MTRIHYTSRIIATIIVAIISLFIGLTLTILLAASGVCGIYPLIDLTSDFTFYATIIATLLLTLICYFVCTMVIMNMFEKIINLAIRGDLIGEAAIRDGYHPKGYCILHGYRDNDHTRALQLVQRHLAYSQKHCVVLLKLSRDDLEECIYIMERKHYTTVYDFDNINDDNLRYTPALSLRIAYQLCYTMDSSDTVYLVYRQRKPYRNAKSVVFLDFEDR